MTVRIPIVSTTVVTALGVGIDSLWRGLMADRCAIAPVQRFDVTGGHTQKAACISSLDEAFNADASRSAMHALLDMLLLPPVPTDAWVLTASTKAGVDNLIKRAARLSANSDDMFGGNLPLQFARRLNAQGHRFNINAACASSTIALARAGQLIASGQAEVVVVGCLDMVTRFVFSGFCALRALSPGGAKPFDRDRDGLNLGEGAALLVLMSETRARQENCHPLGYLVGWAMAADAAHLTAPARDGCGLAAAVMQAMRHAGIGAGDIAAISAHGTGTVYNDAMELTAFEQVFGAHAPVIHSAKGAIGHTLGAAGGIETALALEMLKRQQAPPTVGCIRPDARARGNVFNHGVSFCGRHVLKTNSGFGGINAALILEGVETDH